VSRIPALYEQYGYGLLGTYLPDFFFDIRLLDLQLWQWIGLIGLVVIAGILSWALASIVATVVRAGLRGRADQTGHRIADVVTGPARLAIGVAIFSVAKHLLGLAITVTAVLDAMESLLIVVAVTWAALRLVDVFSTVVEGRLREQGQTSAVTLLPPGRKTLKAFAVIMGTLAGLDSLGFNVTAVLAGLGVGGIAVALAAQKTVENLFGGATLYSDRPVRVGDFCRFGDQVGNVEDIGLRSTRVRTLDRTVVTVPNAEFANLHLENYTLRDKLWYHPRIGLRYETTPDQIRYVLVEVRKMLYAHPKVDPDPARIRFVEFGAYSLDLDVFAYVNVTDYGEFLEVAEDLNLRIMDIVAEAGSGFAFPSQTTYLEQGDPLDTERQEKVGEAVAKWREEKELYIPRFPDEKVKELRNTLDFPPRGSPSGGNGRG
jgi:MscS family membrane protein